jgi:hypothetical protein
MAKVFDGIDEQVVSPSDGRFEVELPEPAAPRR